ncbi:MAG: hypothetical protein QM627_09950 [Luteolibacter sp.]
MKKWLADRLKYLKDSPPVSQNGRLTWDVKGAPLWFESPDVELSPQAEALACLYSAASNLAGWRINFSQPVCPVLAENLLTREQVWHSWWNAHTGHFKIKRPTFSDSQPSGHSAAFLSLGADSFYTVLTQPEIDTVIYVCGYDIPVKDETRLAAFEPRFREAAEQLGKRAIILRTNLREHPVFRRLNWERFHGAALAAAAHLLQHEIDRVLISSSFSTAYFMPWGTSWKTDPLWSSAAVGFDHYGHDLTRNLKLRKIADHPVVQQHLHICWEHRNGRLNCGLCEKCQRTMLSLLSIDRLKDFPTLPSQDELVATLRASAPLKPLLWPTYQFLIDLGLPADISRETEALMERSRQTHPTPTPNGLGQKNLPSAH